MECSNCNFYHPDKAGHVEFSAYCELHNFYILPNRKCEKWEKIKGCCGNCKYYKENDKICDLDKHDRIFEDKCRRFEPELNYNDYFILN